jgi:LmbE family N-acetylglucosaminyl deacetylase
MRYLYLLLFSITIQFGYSQQGSNPNSVEIFNQIQKLRFLGSVLYVAAHPDDENTKLISYFSNNIKAQTAYLSLTRGDGGQNLIGSELREELGIIRTQELLEARKIDGGFQFFTRANDFGFSKTPDESLKIWDKEAVLSDMVWVIRKFQPDVIINRFDENSAGKTHGHHTASAQLSIESFDISNDSKKYSSQLQWVEPWQPKRIFFNTSWWFFGSQENFDKADKTNFITLNTGVYYASSGKSNQEIAALSRSKHKSQGFGTSPNRGNESEYLKLVKGDMPKNKLNIFEGIDTTWNRVKGGKEIDEVIKKVEENFDFKNPAASVTELLKAYELIQKLNENHWKTIKSNEIKSIIAACCGLFIEATTDKKSEVGLGNLPIKLEVINRSSVPMSWLSYTTSSNEPVSFMEMALEKNKKSTKNIEINSNNKKPTTPYWLEKEGSIGMYVVNEQSLIGSPTNETDLKVSFDIKIQNTVLTFHKSIQHKYTDDVKGEVYQPFTIVPEITVSLLNKVAIFSSNTPQEIGVKIKAGKNNCKGEVSIRVSEKWKTSPPKIPFSLTKKDEEQVVYFSITPPSKPEETILEAVATIDEKEFKFDKIEINYDHIESQQIIKPSKSKLIRLDCKKGTEKIAYIMGAGDDVPTYLSQMGYAVSSIKPKEITANNLIDFDVIMMGIRAYNVDEILATKQAILLDYVANGKTMIVQYNTTDKLVTDKIAPFSLSLSRDRVTEENAEIKFLDPTNSVLNFPNKITNRDFDNWVQERGLYYPNEWNSAFTPILSSNDKGESEKKGALLIAQYGKGCYIYTSLSFFRQLPAGVSGAYRLMANLVAAGKKE